MPHDIEFYELEGQPFSIRAKKHDNGMWNVTYSPPQTSAPLPQRWFASLEDLEAALDSLQPVPVVSD